MKCEREGRLKDNSIYNYYLDAFSTISLLSIAEDEPDVLDRPKCLEALAALRHAKWFQVCAVCCLLRKCHSS